MSLTFLCVPQEKNYIIINLFDQKVLNSFWDDEPYWDIKNSYERMTNING